MDLHHFEERIKNMFEHHRPETDNDAIWEHIEPKLKKKKKRRFIIWFFGALGLALPLFFLWNRRVASTTAVLPENAALSTRKRSVKDAPAVPYHLGAAAPATPADSVKTIHFPVAHAPLTIPKIPFSSIYKIEEVFPEAKASYPPLVLADVPEIGLLPVARYGYVVSDTVPKSFVLPKPEIQQKERRFATGNVEDENDKKGKKKRRKKHPLEHNFSIVAGPALAIRHLGKGEATTEHLKARRTTESMLESFTAGMFYSTATRKGLVFKTGLNYRQSSEKFQLAYTTKETEQINGVLTQTVDGAGNLLDQTTGNKTVIKTTVYSNTAYSRYRYVNLPLGIGRRTSGKRSRSEISGGLDVNLLFRARATVYNPDNMLTTYTHGTATYNSMFQRSTGMGLWGSYAYEWEMKDRVWWHLSAHAQVPFHAITRADYGLVQRYFNVGLQAGLTFRMNKGKKKG